MRGSTATFVSIAMCVGVILFRLKYEVLGLENTHQQIKKSIYETKEAIHVLKAEWAHLSDPSRIQKLTIKYLNNGQPLTVKTLEQPPVQNEKKSTSKNKQEQNAVQDISVTFDGRDSLDILFEDSFEAEKSQKTKKNHLKTIAFKKGAKKQ